MNKKITGILFAVCCSLLLIHCSEEEVGEARGDLEFISLVSTKDTIAPGDTTKVTATASGSQLEYFWSATAGDILGSGAEVVYAATPCQTGTNLITCKITSGSQQSKSKTIDIVVYE